MQALLEPCCVSLASTKRAALLHRLQDGVFEPLLEGGQEGALAELDTQQLATCLFDLGVHPCRMHCWRITCRPCPTGAPDLADILCNKHMLDLTIVHRAAVMQQKSCLRSINPRCLCSARALSHVLPCTAGAQEGVKAKNRQICYSLSRALEKASSKRTCTAPKDVQPQPAQQDGAKNPSAKQSAVLARPGLAQAAPEAHKAKPALNALKRQHLAAKLAKVLATSPGQSPDSSVIGRLQQPGKTRAKHAKQHAKSPQHPEDHAGPSSSTDGPQTASALEVPKPGSGRPAQESGSQLSQEDAARLVNAALNGHSGPSPSSALPQLNGKPAGNGVGVKKPKKKHRQSLPTGKAVAADVPQRAAMSAQKHTPAGQNHSPTKAKMPAAQGNGAASAGTELTESQRKNVRCACA